MLKRIFKAIIDARQANADYMVRRHIANMEYRYENPDYVANYILGDKK